MATMKLYELVNHYHIGTELTCAEAMHRDGYLFYLSANGVWLTKAVPATYLKRLEDGLKQH